MAGPGHDDGYIGPATLTVGEARYDVRVELRGHFEPIDGRYHWYGRVGRQDELLSAIGSARVTGSISTPHGSAPCELSEPDAWHRYRVTGVSTPPFAAGTAPPPDGEPAAAGAVPGESPAGESTAGPAAVQEAAGGGELPAHVRVAVIGAGFGGIGAGVKLRQSGLTSFVILERAGSVGGTWRDNTYPGCACDVPSHLYSFSFAPNPDWSRSFSPQSEIWAYLDRVATQYGVREHIRFHTTVREARWDEGSARWQLQTSRGALTADVVISAAGPLSEPAIPAIPGLAQFPGQVFHSSRWDHTAGLAGQRVAVVGTGASAIQIVPEVQRKAGHLVLFQRTPAWVMPRRDRAITPAERWLYRHVPPTQKLARLGIYLSREALVLGFVKRPGILRRAQRTVLSHMEKAIADPELRAKLTPDYILGCKRVLLSNTFYRALARPNVDVVAAGLAKVEGSTLVAQDGTSHEVDAVVLATGFRAIDMPIAKHVHGVGGVSLAEAWGSDMRALRGTTIPGFPNLCLVIGPNTGLGHNSLVHVIESQLSYIMDYLATLETTGAAALDAREAAADRWAAGIEHRMRSTVWTTGGCVSWYLNEDGRNPTLWPGGTMSFRRATRRLDLAEYHLVTPRVPA
jgi:cation diffusion facilitator CzcD-associated flavoprotein CzcO